jgi:CDP-glucose 4,6-dehydratase
VGERARALAGLGLTTALVTGAHGLLGAWLAKALLARGVRVVVLVRDAARRSALTLDGTIGHCAVAVGDVRDDAAVERAVAAHAVDTVFHLAAQTIVGEARRDPAATFDVNVGGTWTVLDAARRHGVERAVVASTDKVYGATGETAHREDLPLRPRDAYEASKAAAEVVARSYWASFGLPVATTRFGNVYGGGDLNASRLIPEAVAAALAGRPPVIRSDGTPRRDFVYVEDAVAAHLALADALGDPQAGARGEAFNGGGDRPHSVLEVVALVCRAAGADVEPDVRGEAPGAGGDRGRIDSSRLRRVTGWAPRVGLEDGLRRTVAWYREHQAAPAA